jgi:acetyl-CoA carboxylase carboxyl transferase subunit alpha
MATPSNPLEFERPLIELEKKIDELKSISGKGAGAVDMSAEIGRLEKKEIGRASCRERVS